MQFADRVRSISATGLDTVIDEMPAELASELAQFDEIISWYGSNRPEFRAVMPRCVFLAALPTADWTGHATDFFLNQVGAPMGLIPRIGVPDVQRRDSVVIHPFSGSARKNWPLENFRRVAGSIRGNVEWVAGPEEELAGAQRFGDLMELAKWMAGARLYLGNDSGVSHLAAAIGVPSIVIFRCTDPQVWGAQGENVLNFLVG